MSDRKWVAGAIGQPVWRDGLTSTLTYLIVAVEKEAGNYNCVCIRPFGNGQNKVKFYPGPQEFKMTKTDLINLGANSFLDRTGRGAAGYLRMFMDNQAVEKLLAQLGGQRGVQVVPFDLFEQAVAGKLDKDTALCRTLHPQDGGGTPTTPFTSPEVEAAPVAKKGTRGNPINS